ncbi:sodium:proton antiporter [Cupriavidus basilensis]
MSAGWGLPFAGMLLSIALFPPFAPRFWHHHYGKIAAAWSVLFLLPFGVVFGAHAALGGAVHALLGEWTFRSLH